MPTLQDLGWNAVFEQQLSDEDRAEFCVARVIEEQKERYILAGDDGIRPAEVSGRLRHRAQGRRDFPAVGDWVLAQRPDTSGATANSGPALIHRVLDRLTKLARKVPGRETEEQILAANVDIVFVTASLNKDLNPRRIERTLTLVKESGALPVILLTKADLCEDDITAIREIQSVARGIDVLSVAALEGREGKGMRQVRDYITSGQTAVLLGSSGVGKSTLVNALAGREILATGAIREDDDRGRHTTSHRQLVHLEGGGMVVDTPGLRELQLWAGEEALDQTFDDIVALAKTCRFNDCEHQTEPGCAINEAIQAGTLEEARWQNFLKMKKELAYTERRGDKAAESEQKKKWRTLHRTAYVHIKNKRRIDA